MADRHRWRGRGYANVPGQVLKRARWNLKPLRVELADSVLVIAVRSRLFPKLWRREIALGSIWYVQDADMNLPVGPFLPGVRIVGTDRSVSFIWFQHARRVRSALAQHGVEVREPIEDTSPGTLGRWQYEA